MPGAPRFLMDQVAEYIWGFIRARDAHLSRIAGQEAQREDIHASIGEEVGRLLAVFVSMIQAKSVPELGSSIRGSTARSCRLAMEKRSASNSEALCTH